MGLTMARQGVLSSRSGPWWKLLREFVALHAGMGSFGCAAASHSRSSRFAQDDSGVEGVSKTQRDGTVESHISQRTRNMGHPFFVERDGTLGPPPAHLKLLCHPERSWRARSERQRSRRIPCTLGLTMTSQGVLPAAGSRGRNSFQSSWHFRWVWGPRLRGCFAFAKQSLRSG